MNHATRQATLRTDLSDANMGVSMGTEPDFPKGRTDVGVFAAPEAEERTQRLDEDLLQAIREDAHLQRQIQNAPPGVDLSSLLAEPLRGGSVDGDWGIEGWGESDENARLSSELDRLLQSSLFPNDHSTQFRTKAAEEDLPSAQWLRKSTPLLHGRPGRASTGGAASKGGMLPEEPQVRKEPRVGAREGWSKVPSTTEMSRQMSLDALRQRPDSAQPKPSAAKTTGELVSAPKGVESRVRVAEALADPSLLVEEVRLSSQPSEDDTSQFSPNEIHAILSLAPEEDDEAEVFQSPPPGKASASLHEEVTRDVTRSARQAAGHTSARERFKEADETTRRVSLQARKREQTRGGSGEQARGGSGELGGGAKAPAPSAPGSAGEGRSLLRAPQARGEGRPEAVSAPVAAVGPMAAIGPMAVSGPMAATGEVRAMARGQASQLTGEVRAMTRGQALAMAADVGLEGARLSGAPTTAKLYRAPQVTEAAVAAGEQTAARGPVVAGWGWQRLLGVAVGMSMILSSSVPLAQVPGAWPWSPVIALIPIMCGAVFILSQALGVAQLFQRMVFVVFGGLFLAFCATPGFFHLLGAFQAWEAGVPQLALVLLLVGAAPREVSPSSGSH